MNAKRMVEIFSAGCPVCETFVEQVRKEACPSCEVTVLDMKLPDVYARAKALGVNSVPAVAIDGKLLICCWNRGPDMAALRAAGLGKPD